MKHFLLLCLSFISLSFLQCGEADPDCPYGYTDQLIETFGFSICLPISWTGEEMKRTDPVTGEEMTHVIYRQEPVPGKPLIGLERFDFWGFEDDFEAFKIMSGEDASASGQNMRVCKEGETKSGIPYWMTELAYEQASEQVVAQNYYYFPEDNYDRAFIMRAFCLKEVFVTYQDTFKVCGDSFDY